MDLTTAIISGFLVGVLSAVVGYIKNFGIEKFDMKKAAPALFFGLISGCIVYWQGVDLNDPKEAATLAFLITLANNFIVLLDKNKFFNKKGRLFDG